MLIVTNVINCHGELSFLFLPLVILPALPKHVVRRREPGRRRQEESYIMVRPGSP